MNTMNIVSEWRKRAVNLEARSTELSERTGDAWSLTSACVLARSEILNECADTLEASIEPMGTATDHRIEKHRDSPKKYYYSLKSPTLP